MTTVSKTFGAASSVQRYLAIGILVIMHAALAAGVLVRGQASLDDAAILGLFDQANAADIETARLGIERGHSDLVKNLARGVASDHEAVRRMGRDLARKLRIVPAVPPGDTAKAEHAKALAKLRALSGDAFDQAYVTHEIAFHASVIDAVKQALIPAAHDPEVKALLEKVLPGFEHHLAETRSVATKLGTN